MHQISLEKQRIETSYTSCGAVIFFLLNRDKELRLEMKSNRTFWVKWRNGSYPSCHFRNGCGLENITLIKSERQKILSIFIYKNTWEYKKVAKQWGYRLKTEWIHWYLQFLQVRLLMLHLGEPRDSQCCVKKRESEGKKAFNIDILWSLPSAPCKPDQFPISFQTRLFRGDVFQLKQRHTKCHIMTKK